MQPVKVLGTAEFHEVEPDEPDLDRGNCEHDDCHHRSGAVIRPSA
jgi:hypothetical protein